MVTNKSSWLILSALVLILALIAVGCGSNTPSTLNSPSPANTSAPVEQPTTAPANTQGAAPQAASQTLTVAISSSLDNFDPLTNAGDPFRNSVRLTMYNTLMAYDSQTTELIPSLTQSYDVKNDGQTYIFHLRPNVKWHDGTPLKAADVKYTFGRVADKTVGVYYADLLSDVSKVTVIDDNTVQVDLSEKSVGFLDALINMSIVKDGSGDTNRTKPIGTGPFRFVQFVPNEKLVLEANPDYWEAGLPTIKGLVIVPISDSQVALQNLEAGSIDVVMDIPAALVASVKGRNDITLIQKPTTTMAYIDFFSKNMPSKDPRIRQAMVMCLDYKAVDQIVYGGIGYAGQNIIPQGTWAYTPIEDYPYDPVAAKKLLAEAGFPKGFKITIDGLGGFDTLNQIATVWQGGLKECGITADVRVQEFNAWLDGFFKHTLQVSMDIDSQGPDPYRFYNISFVGPHAGGGDAVSPELLTVGKQANGTIDTAARKALWAKYAELAHVDLHAVPIYRTPALAITKPNITGIQINLAAFYNFDQVKIAP